MKYYRRANKVSQTHCTYDSHLSFLDLAETIARRNEHVLRVPREPYTSRPPTAVALSLGGESLEAAHGGVLPMSRGGTFLSMMVADGRGLRKKRLLLFTSLEQNKGSPK